MTASVTQSFTQAILSRLEQLNIAIDPELLSRIRQHQDDARLPMALQDALWQWLEQHNERGLGLHIGLAMLPQHFDTIGFLLLSSPSLSVAVDSLINYSPLIGEGGQFAKTHTAQGWSIRYDARFTIAVSLRIEAIFASIATGARWVAGKNITPVAVCFSHAQQAPDALYQQAFGEAEVNFEHAHNAIVYADSDWHYKQREVNPAVQAQMLGLANQQLAQLSPQNFVEQVEALLTNQPWLSRAQIAASLAVSERTLQRRLRASDTHYQALAQHIRKQHALAQIHKPHVTQASLADYLGYSDESAFAKAFKRWTGMGFRDYRRTQIKHDD
ncbi:AraC family transcriptional regulator [Alteromonas sp. CYL-A6]|uniref:AraC family transcriptional regulator n=1 Tax=Alteromonas nitratireducens TaxID=3390813 RepID=UPI0034ADB1B2